jgi:DNA-binding NtrC family response regulator
MMVRLLLIDDEEASLAASFTRAPLSDTPWVCDQADWNSITYDRLDRRAADLIVVSASSRSSQILGFLTWLRAHAEAAPTIAVLPQNPERELLRVCFDAADDCVLSPVHGDELRQRIARVLGTSDHTAAAVKDRLNNEFGFSQLVGSDPKFLREIHKISLAARGDSEVLITGETGTGKELCARAIHHLSRRRDFPFVCVDCGALPDQLFENEVFGHARGAFTGAHNVQKGLVAIAEGGTLFLDEIDSLSLQAQAKLLRFLQGTRCRAFRPRQCSDHSRDQSQPRAGGRRKSVSS